MNKYRFRRLAREGNWHPDRITAWIHCHEHYGVEFPGDDWTLEEVEAVSEKTMEIYFGNTAQSTVRPVHKSVTEQALDGVTEGFAEVAAHICIHAAKEFFRKR